jgi:Glycosyl transferase family group 2
MSTEAGSQSGPGSTAAHQAGRPAVSVVMPFAGDPASARLALQTLLELETRPGDELILADNSGVAPVAEGVAVVQASSERSPAHARNVGAARAQSDWILFLDADCLASGSLLDAYFAEPIAPDVGALAGEVVPSADGATLAAQYGAARSFLSQERHLAHPYLPRAVAANLLVRRAAFEQVGGFYEGMRAAEDTDFSWRIQRAGWRLEPRPQACVEHRYRQTLSELRRQWRGYAAGRAWLGRRYDGFEPEPALRRAGGRAWRLARGVPARPRPTTPQPIGASSRAGRMQRGRYRVLDAWLGAEELAGLALSNRPLAGRQSPRLDGSGSAQVVLVADRFPARGDPLADFARTLERARVEAVARPESVDVDVARALAVHYREDEGAAARAGALARLAARHPVRCAADLIHRQPGEPRLGVLAPAAVRLQRDTGARVHALGGEAAQAAARRLGALAGRSPHVGEP